MSTGLRLRNPALRCEKSEDNYTKTTTKIPPEPFLWQLPALPSCQNTDNHVYTDGHVQKTQHPVPKSWEPQSVFGIWYFWEGVSLHPCSQPGLTTSALSALPLCTFLGTFRHTWDGFGLSRLGEKVLPALSVWRPGRVAKQPTMRRTALPEQENYLAPNVSSAEVEKSCFETGSWFQRLVTVSFLNWEIEARWMWERVGNRNLVSNRWGYDVN